MGIVEDLIKAGTQVVSGVGAAVDFGSDPMGFLFAKVQDAANGLAGTVLPALFEATKPDLSLEWFLRAWAISYGLGVFVWVSVLLWSIFQASRGVFDSADIADLLTTRAGIFFGLCTFGPMAGWVLLQAVGALTDGIAMWAIGDSTAAALASLQALISSFNGTAITGGILMGLVLMCAMLVGLVLVVLSLFALMIAVYLGGAAVPIAAAWQAHPRFNTITTKVLQALLGALLAKPLLFFALGVAFSMAGGSMTWLANPDLASLAQMVAATIAIIVAGLTPFALFSFMPVLPSGAGQAGPGLRAGGGGNDGPSSPSSSNNPAWDEAQRNAAEPEQNDSGTGSSTTVTDGSSGSGADGDGASTPGPIETALSERRGDSGQAGGPGGADGAAGDDGADSGGVPEEGPAAAEAPGASGAEAGMGTGPAAAAAGTGPSAAGVGAGAGGGGTAGAAAGGAEAGGAAAGGEVAAAGAAGAATGGLALVAIAAAKAGQGAANAAQSVGDQAAADLDGGTQ